MKRIELSYTFPVHFVVGTQFGDEGKGKVIDEFASGGFGVRPNVVSRYSGGPNAGHTVYLQGKPVALHSVPSGIFSPGVISYIGHRSAINPLELLKELALLKELGVDISRLRIGKDVLVIMPWHLDIESAEEEALGEGKIGTPRRGIGPTYADYTSRRAILVGDLLDPDRFSEKMKLNITLKGLYQGQMIHQKQEDYTDEFLHYGKRLKSFIVDPDEFFKEVNRKGQMLLMESSQGALLDLDSPSYPFVTSCGVTTFDGLKAFRLNPGQIRGVWGVVKAYTTRVGNGHLPTELPDRLAGKLRNRGKEFGATSGRPRRIGWLDLAIVRHAVQVNLITALVVTKLDVLDELKTIKVCVGYSRCGTVLGQVPTLGFELCRPKYAEFPGWQTSTRGISDRRKLPKRTKVYLDFIEKHVGVPIRYVSTGLERGETLLYGEGKPKSRNSLK